MKKKLKSIGVDTTHVISANCEVTSISISKIHGNPTLRIGSYLNGDDLMGDTPIIDYLKIRTDRYFERGGRVYFTFLPDPGEVNINIKIRKNIF